MHMKQYPGLFHISIRWHELMKPLGDGSYHKHSSTQNMMHYAYEVYQFLRCFSYRNYYSHFIILMQAAPGSLATDNYYDGLCA